MACKLVLLAQVGDGSDYRSLLGDLGKSDVEEDLEEVKLFLFRLSKSQDNCDFFVVVVE